jgi:antitoxin VapB
MNKAKVFQSGNSQAVRLPAEFAVSVSELHIRKIGGVILLSEPQETLAGLEAVIERFTSDFMSDGRDQPSLPDSVFYLNDESDDYSA